MSVAVVALAAALLAIERVCYVLAWRRPDAFCRWAARCGIARDGVCALERCFYAFKLIQAGVFVGWWRHFATGALLPFDGGPLAIACGALLVAAGQLLNFSAAHRLGRIGMFYGVRFGHVVPRCTRFPYSVLSHPQYVGTVATIWGLFLLVRFPHPDWWIVPAIETAWYALGAVLENERQAAAVEPLAQPATPATASTGPKRAARRPTPPRLATPGRARTEPEAQHGTSS